MNPQIIQFIWFEDQAEKAAEWYIDIFPESKINSKGTIPDTPSGDASFVNLEIWGTPFLMGSLGKHSSRNPSFSYMAACPSLAETDRIWQRLSEGAEILMPFQEYPFAERYGWLKDKYGVSWQVMPDGGMEIKRISPCLLFTGEVCGRAEEAMNYYSEMFSQAGVSAGPLDGHVSRYGDSEPSDEKDKPELLNYARFHLGEHEIVVMDSSLEHGFSFNQMQTFMIECLNQAKIDYFWEKLSAVPEAEQCGWLEDRFGVSWQIVPKILSGISVHGSTENKRTLVKTFLPMKKLLIKPIQEAVYPPEHRIVIEAEIKGDIDKIWNSWVNPHHVINWNFASDDWHCPQAENDPVTGGVFKFTMASKDGSAAFDFEGSYDEVIPKKKIVYTMFDGRQAEVIFREEGEKISITESFDPESQHTVELQRGGWQSTLNNFKKYTEQI